MRELLMEKQSEREAKLFLLAERLQFTVEKTGNHFTLTRTADVERPVREGGRNIAQAEELLEVWKLRGFHGG